MLPLFLSIFKLFGVLSRLKLYHRVYDETIFGKAPIFNIPDPKVIMDAARRAPKQMTLLISTITYTMNATTKAPSTSTGA